MDLILVNKSALNLYWIIQISEYLKKKVIDSSTCYLKNLTKQFFFVNVLK